MATILTKPDSVNLSGNMNKFILSSSSAVRFSLIKGDKVLLTNTYEPGTDGLITIDIKEVVETELNFLLDISEPVYFQPELAVDFIAIIDITFHTFKVIKCGVANLSDTATNFLKLHFLSWQPKIKKVTYYSPEWLTYYGVQDSTVKLKATFEDKTAVTINIGEVSVGKAITCNMQYGYISGKLGNKYPVHYEVWVEAAGKKLTESQFYVYSDKISEDESWFLFENSLGGIDSFRASGVNKLKAEHKYQTATFGETKKEYDVEIERKYTKNTGYLNEYSRRWMLDFFPSKGKYVYGDGAIKKIVLIDDDVNYTSSDLPSSYTFTYEFAEATPYLNLIRNENEIPDNITIPSPESPDFILPPRLVEFPRQELHEGVLLPAADPYNPRPSVTTYGMLFETIRNAIIREVSGIIGEGGGAGDGIYHIMRYDLTEPSDTNAFTALRTLFEINRNMEDVLDNRFIRKDIEDFAHEIIRFLGGLETGKYVPGLLGDGALIDKDGHAEMTSLKLREFLEVPELRFNRIDVVSGELWNSIAFGLIEEVDTDNHIAVMKLEDGELMGLHINDFCRGIFHNLTGNATAEGKDDSGFDRMVGFSTAYFTPVEIMGDNSFKYELKPGSSVHPCKGMKFAVYGHPLDKNRQSSAYHTRTYTRYLRGVSTWKIERHHVSMQLGDLSGLSINGESMAEGSAYLNNIYFGGNIWFTPEMWEEIKGNDAYSVILSTYSAVFNIADGMLGEVDVVQGDDSVVSGINNVITKTFNVYSRIQAFKGSEQLRYSETIGKGRYVVSHSGKDCKYIITDGLIVIEEVIKDQASITIEVNCEGFAVYELLFTITRVANGEDGKDYEYIFRTTRTQTRPSTPTGTQEDDYVPSGWTDDPVGPTASYPYEWVCKRTKIRDYWGTFSTPALWAKYSFDGEDGDKGDPGTDGKSDFTVYRRSGSQPSTPTGTTIPPSGWALDPPTGSTPLWFSKATFNADGTIYRLWSTPVNIKGESGIDGDPGPAISFRGVYTATKQYSGTKERVEVVKHGTYYYITKVTAGVFSNQTPVIDNSYWTRLQGQFESLATGLLIAEKANISGWDFRDNHISSQNNNVVLDGNADSGPRIALGASYSNRLSAPLRMYEDGRLVANKGEFQDGCTMGNFIISGGSLRNKSNHFAMISTKDSYSDVTFGTQLIPDLAGGAFTLLARINNSHNTASPYYKNRNIGLEVSCTGSTVNQAINIPSGDVYLNGGNLIVFERPFYTSAPRLDTIYNNFMNFNKFIFQPYEYLSVRVPSADQITDAIGKWDASFNSSIEIKILITRHATESINLQGVNGTVLINNNGDIPRDNNNTGHNYGNINLSKGDAVTIYYYNNAWYITSLSR